MGIPNVEQPLFLYSHMIMVISPEFFEMIAQGGEIQKVTGYK